MPLLRAPIRPITRYVIRRVVASRRRGLTNRTDLDALTICALDKSRWQVELFFRRVKQHLRVKRFFGTSEKPVKSQLWIAVSVYVLVAIIRKRLGIETSL